MTVSALMQQCRSTNAEGVTTYRKPAPEQRAAAETALREAEAALAGETRRLVAALFGGRAWLSQRVNKNPFAARVGRAARRMAAVGAARLDVLALRRFLAS